jgi:hypothetical protein
MSVEEVQAVVNPFIKAAGLPLPHARAEGSIHLLLDESRARAIELIEGQKIRLKTQTDTAIIESIALMDSMSKTTALNFVGGEAASGEGWTDKLQRKGGGEAAEPIPGDELQGADDDEWGDDDDDD